MITSKIKNLDQVLGSLLNDDITIKAIRKQFGYSSDSVLSALEIGKFPEVDGIHLYDFLTDLLLNEPRKFKTYWAKNEDGAYPIQIFGLGSVFYYWAPEFDRVGYFDSEEAAASDIVSNWSDSLIKAPKADH